MLIVSQIRELRPGGWLEVCDFVYPMVSFGGTIPRGTALYDWNHWVIEASRHLGVGLDRTRDYARKMGDAGFQRVYVCEYLWPLGWGTDAKSRFIGKQTDAWKLCWLGGL